MKLITIEEHIGFPFVTAAVQQAMRMQVIPTPSKEMLDAAIEGGAAYPVTRAELDDIDARIAYMDANQIDMMVLSFGDSSSGVGMSNLPQRQYLDLIQAINDHLAAIVTAHPTRFAAFATLPMAVPEAAASELERAIVQLGLRGAMILGNEGERFIDAPEYEPLLAMADKLGAPLYLHPGLPAKAVAANYYAGLQPRGLNVALATAGWGWHMEAGVNVIRLIYSGAFDRYPDLQIISGHWGEFVPTFLERLDEACGPVVEGHLQKHFSDYYREHVYVTPSGMYNPAQMEQVMSAIGAAHIIWSQDYPYVKRDNTRSFLAATELNDADKARISHGNAEQLLDL